MKKINKRDNNYEYIFIYDSQIHLNTKDCKMRIFRTFSIFRTYRKEIFNIKLMNYKTKSFTNNQTCKLLDDVSKRSRICSLYISKKEHLQVNFSFSSLRASFSCHTREY